MVLQKYFHYLKINKEINIYYMLPALLIIIAEHKSYSVHAG